MPTRRAAINGSRRTILFPSHSFFKQILFVPQKKHYKLKENLEFGASSGRAMESHVMREH